MPHLIRCCCDRVRKHQLYANLTAKVKITAAIALILSVTCAEAQVTFETRTLSGQQAPGVETNATFTNFLSPTINSSGQTVFTAGIAGVGSGIFSDAAGTIGRPGLVARTGAPAPGVGPGIDFRGFGGFTGSRFLAYPVSDNGEVAFAGLFDFAPGNGITPFNDTAIYSGAVGSNGAPGILAREGAQVPGLPAGIRFGSFDFTEPRINAAGQTAFVSRLSGSGVTSDNNSAIFSDTRNIGTPSLIVRAGDLVPDIDPDSPSAGSIFTSLNPPAFNDAGQVAFVGNFSPPEFLFLGDSEGIFSEALGTPGNPRLLVRVGDQASVSEPDISFRSFESLTLNASGQSAFAAFLGGDNVDSGNDVGIFSEAAGTSGSPGLVAREGNQAPGTEAGTTFSDLSFDFTFNDAGQTAFASRLSGNGVDTSNDVAIFSEAAGSIGSPGLVVREGDQAAGTAPGVVFAAFNLPDNFNLDSPAAAINAAGQVAFLASLTGNGVDATNDSGIWVADSDGSITLVVREGDLFDVDDDPTVQDLRTISDLTTILTTSNGDGLPSSFNDFGQITFTLEFTDGSSGVFVANVPEPTAVAIAMLLIAGLMAYRRGGPGALTRV
ncbi:MAG: choice-of-anchor tandem repeat NxxGxxAF-containing protein [Planctomycetota bacterium]